MRTVGARLAAPEDYAAKLLVNPCWHETDLTVAEMIRGEGGRGTGGGMGVRGGGAPVGFPCT